MPRYVLEFTTLHGVERTDAIEFDDEETLRREAVRSAKDLMREGITEGRDRTGWRMRVYDEQNREILHLSFADLLKAE